MVGALWTGISGLAGQQTALDNESNNIANVNTIGFKSSRISFADQFYQNKIGKGAQVLDAEKLYSQGNLKLTGVSYDMALAGDGFFAVSNTRGGGTSATYYTRAGNFRMGDSGTLQDTVGNEVQGWAVGTDPIVESTNPNVSIFTSDYTKLLSSKIINYSSAVETVTAKATDFTLTAASDESSIFTGAGLKTKYGKIADVEELIKAYTSALQALKDDPNSSSASATSQIAHINLAHQTTPDAVSQDGDEVYVYIDGNKISQSYISGTDAQDGYRKTMKAFADKISETPGLKAYVAANDASFTPSTDGTDVDEGIIRIESIIPGQSFTISSTGMVHDGNDKPGSFAVNTVAETGRGLGRLESVRDALSEAISGKQTDVYTPADLEYLNVQKGLSYQIEIYNKGTGKNETVPDAPLVITAGNADTIDKIVTAINSNTDLDGYVKAENLNGNLVVRTLESNFDVEFSGAMQATYIGATKTTPAGDPGVPDNIAEVYTYNLNNAPSPDGGVDYRLTIGGVSVDSNNRTTLAQVAADLTAIAGYTVDLNGDGQLRITNDTDDTAFIPELYIDDLGDGGNFVTADNVAIKRNTDYSGREGAGAEFLEIKTKIDQTATKGSLQLRLDTLGISDSAFGDFEVDETGLVTMKQDGAMFAVGQVAIAKFITNRGLDPIGNNLFESTLASGDPIYNLNNDKTAEVKANTLELSTADLSESLVNLMVFQRAFEANAKSITTADTILNTLIQLKR
jgi:flagellar hook protein FlgE